MPPYEPGQSRGYRTSGYDPAQVYGAPTRRKRRWAPILLIVAAVLGLCAVGGIIAGAFASASEDSAKVQTAEDSARPAPRVTVTKTVTAPAPAVATKVAPKPVTIEDGTWEIGSEVKPGTYTTTADGHCYWARLKDFDGGLFSIIANGNLADGQRGRITIRKSDAGIELNGDCVWTRK